MTTTTTDGTWLLYGANGYTGALVAEEAVRRGLRPVLAGRRDEALAPLAERLGLPRLVFGLDSPERVARELSGVRLVLHCAGPFSRTSAPVLEACLRTGAHYLDVTGEVSVFEACHARGDEARARGVVVLPGVGFDVVPTDCLAATLAAALPGAESLELAFAGEGGLSQGTAKTIVEGLAQGGAIRRGGRIERVPVLWRTATVAFRDRPRHAVSVPWGDVATAFHSTGIGNVVVYMALPRSTAALLRVLRPALPLLRRPSLQRLAERAIERFVRGPGEVERHTLRSQLWGRVTHGDGRTVEGTLVTLEGYQLTVCTALLSVERVLRGGVAPGFHTPATAFGPAFVTEVAGCDLRVGTVVAPAAR